MTQPSYESLISWTAFLQSQLTKVTAERDALAAQLTPRSESSGTTVTAAPPDTSAISDRERRLLDGFDWLRAVTHAATHDVAWDPARGRVPLTERVHYSDCSHRSCVYATRVLTQARAGGSP